MTAFKKQKFLAVMLAGQLLTIDTLRESKNDKTS
jgi:hypothetical protein